MPATETTWDARHRENDAATPEEPASIVCQLLPMLADGPVLDIACGRGRHALLVASPARPVTAVDWSSAGLDILSQRAHAVGIPVRGAEVGSPVAPSPGGILTIRLDLERVSLPPRSFQTVVNTHYLQRSLFPQIESALRPGGMLIFETFTRAHVGGPNNPDFLLEEGELRHAFPSLDVIFYREIRAGKGMATLVGVKPF